MHKLDPDRGSSNVNVTLDPAVDGFGGLEFPCPFCGAGLAILLTKRNNLTARAIHVESRSLCAVRMELSGYEKW
jgi:hypothetical protein